MSCVDGRRSATPLVGIHTLGLVETVDGHRQPTGCGDATRTLVTSVLDMRFFESLAVAKAGPAGRGAELGGYNVLSALWSPCGTSFLTLRNATLLHNVTELLDAPFSFRLQQCCHPTESIAMPARQWGLTIWLHTRSCTHSTHVGPHVNADGRDARA